MANILVSSMPNTAPDIPGEILKKIKNAWVAGIISGSVTLIFAILAIAGISILGFTAWYLLDAALIFGLTFGIYKKSRVCAVVMLVYFIISKVFYAVSYDKSPGIVGLVFLYFFVIGVIGTFQYHRSLRSQKVMCQSAHDANALADVVALLSRPRTQPVGMSSVRIVRYVGFQDLLRSYKVMLDGAEIGKLRRGESGVFPVPAGQHTLCLGLDTLGSETVNFTAKENETITFYARANCVGAKMFFGIFYVLFSPKSYLLIEQTPSAEHHTLGKNIGIYVSVVSVLIVLLVGGGYWAYSNGYYHAMRGGAAMERKNYDEALTFLMAAYNTNPGALMVAHDIACCYARKGDNGSCFHWLEIAFKSWYASFAKKNAIKDHDFDSVRQTPEFQSLIYDSPK